MRRATAVSMLAVAPWIGVFDLSVSGGTADTKWTLHHADAGPCDVSENGSGSESGSLTPGAPVTVSLAGVGSTAFLAPATDLRATALLDREGSVTSGADDGDDGEGCPSGGGGDQAPAPDCGPRSLRLSFTFVPGTTPGLSGESGDTPWLNCPVEGATLPAVPSTLMAPTLVSGVGPAPYPPFTTVQLVGTDTQNDADTDLTTKLEVQLRLERVAIVSALDVPDSFNSAPVDKHGRTSVPVSCPAGAACGGTVAIAVGGFGSESERAASPPAWPRPLLTPEPALGSARFRLKAGKRAKVRLVLAHGSAAALKAFAGEKLDVVVRQTARGQKKPIAFVAGQVRLRLR